MSNLVSSAIAGEIIDAFNDHDAQRLADMHSGTAKLYMASTDPVKAGRVQIRDFFDGIFNGWPDCKWTKTRDFGLGDLVCMEYRFNGNSTRYPGLPIETWDCGVFRLEGDEIAETRFYFDTGSVAKQREAQGV